MFDDEFQALLAQQAAHAQQVSAAMSGLAQYVGAFRAELRQAGFTDAGAEDLCRDLFQVILDRADLDSDGDGEDQ